MGSSGDVLGLGLTLTLDVFVRKAILDMYDLFLKFRRQTLAL